MMHPDFSELRPSGHFRLPSFLLFGILMLMLFVIVAGVVCAWW